MKMNGMAEVYERIQILGFSDALQLHRAADCPQALSQVEKSNKREEQQIGVERPPSPSFRRGAGG